MNDGWHSEEHAYDIMLESNDCMKLKERLVNKFWGTFSRGETSFAINKVVRKLLNHRCAFSSSLTQYH